MSEPFIYISTLRIKDGKLQDFKQSYREFLEFYKANEPQLIAFLNEDGNEATSIQIHPDAASMDFHMQVLKEKMSEGGYEIIELIEIKQIEIYGTPSTDLLEADRPLVEAGIARRVMPLHIGGFSRSTAD
jgi:hypothetical protein